MMNNAMNEMMNNAMNEMMNNAMMNDDASSLTLFLHACPSG